MSHWRSQWRTQWSVENDQVYKLKMFIQIERCILTKFLVCNRLGTNLCCKLGNI